MSDYKVVESQVMMTNKQRLVECVEQVLGVSPKLNATITNIWSHTKRVDVAISQNQLPQDLRGFGDIGLVAQNGKFNWVSISESDARLVDNRSNNSQEAGQRFYQRIQTWQQEIENAYAAKTFAQEEIYDVAPTGVNMTGNAQQISDPTGEVSNAWGIPVEVDEDFLVRNGIPLPTA